MLEMLHELFEQGYHFVECSYYGQSKVEDFEEVEDAVEESRDGEYLHFWYEIDKVHREVYFGVDDDE